MITIAHLYYDLLNLYGENGNIKALKKAFEDQGVKVKICFVTLDDELDFKNYDLVYMGAGTEENQNLILPHLLKYKDIIKEEIEGGKFYFITGNAINLFGSYIIDSKDKKKNTLNVFRFYSKEEIFRMKDECIMKCSFLKSSVIGFQNQQTVMKDNNKHLFEVVKGVGSYPKSNNEGILYKNFYGTYVIGPILVRNPELLEYLVKKVINSKFDKFKFKKFDLKLDRLAYNNFNKIFNKDYVK